MPNMDEMRERSFNMQNSPRYRPGLGDEDDEAPFKFSGGIFDDEDDEDDGPLISMRQGGPMRSESNAFQNSFNNGGMNRPPMNQGGGLGGTPLSRGGMPGGGVGGSPMGVGSYGGSPMNRPMPMGSMNQLQQQPQNVDDIIWGGLKVGGHAVKTFGQACKECFTGNNYKSLVDSCYNILKVSCGVAILSLVLALLGMFIPLFENWVGMLVGAGLSCVVAFVGIALWGDKALAERDEVVEEPIIEEPIPQPIMRAPARMDMPAFAEEDEEDKVEDEEPFLFDDDHEDEEYIVDEEEEEVDVADSVVTISPEQAILQMPIIQPHTQTRQYLFETYNAVLPRLSPGFNEMKVLSKSSDVFVKMQNYLMEEASLQEIPSDKMPKIEEVRENGFLYQVHFITTSKKVRDAADKFADSLAKMFSHEEDGRLIPKYEGMYGIATTNGARVILSIFKGKASNSLISLGDCMPVMKDKILDPSIKMPMIYGVRENGQVNFVDYSKTESIAVSGKPRTGKSWQVKEIVSQMCMYTPPSDLCIEVFDIKGHASDFVAMIQYLPHFRIFRNTPESIIDRLDYIFNVEAKRRERILAENNCINISDLHAKHPEVNFPWLYLVFDEMASLGEQIVELDAKSGKKSSKEFQQRYKGYLKRLATQTPNLGIRAIYIPHRLVQPIIEKTTCEMIATRMCVRANRQDLEAGLSLGKNNTFNYSLTQPGDMGMIDSSLNGGKAFFNHGVALAKDNDAVNEIFKFIGYVWSKCTPEFKPHLEQVTNKAIDGHQYIDVDYGKLKNMQQESSQYRSSNYADNYDIQDNDLFSKKVEAVSNDSWVNWQDEDDDADGGFKFKLG